MPCAWKIFRPFDAVLISHNHFFIFDSLPGAGAVMAPRLSALARSGNAMAALGKCKRTRGLRQ